MDKIITHLGIMPYVDRFSQNFLLARWSVSYLLVYTWHTLLHYPHGPNAGCDLAGVAPVVAKVHQSGPWGRAVDGWPWRAAGMDFWNKRHGFLAPIVAEVRQSGPWEQAVDGRPWRAAEMNFWNKRHGFLALIVSKVCQIGPCMLTKPLTMFISGNPIEIQWVSRK